MRFPSYLKGWEIDGAMQDAVPFAVVRDRLEKAWRREGQISWKDYNDVTDHRSIYPAHKKLLSRYYREMLKSGRKVSKLVRQKSASEIFHGYFRYRPEVIPVITSTSYGIHLDLGEEDFKKAVKQKSKFKPKDVGGLALGSIYKGVAISIGKVPFRNFKSFVESNLVDVLKDKKLNSWFTSTVGMDMINYLQLNPDTNIYNSERMRNVLGWLRDDPRASKHKFGHDAFLDALTLGIETEKHEMEHLYNRHYKKMQYPLNELIAYSNPYALLRNMEITKDERKGFKKLYGKTMKKDFGKFFDTLRKVRTSETNAVFNSAAKRRIFPSLLLHLEDLDFIAENIESIIERVQHMGDVEL